MTPTQLIKRFIHPLSTLNIEETQVQEFSLFAVLMCDHLWMARIRAKFQNKQAEPLNIAREVNDSFVSHCKAWKEGSSRKSEIQLWCLPPMGWVKCNFDAAIRDPGNVIAMVCRTNAWSELLQPGEPIWGEVRAALFALSKTGI
uniref:Uncharacterized protein n=1 Tax=Fagus sylvatica TaxID=28930 RepID=A0A2N9I1Q5_FAGSY